jgi:hypothetical protein
MCITSNTNTIPEKIKTFTFYTGIFTFGWIAKSLYDHYYYWKKSPAFKAYELKDIEYAEDITIQDKQFIFDATNNRLFSYKQLNLVNKVQNSGPIREIPYNYPGRCHTNWIDVNTQTGTARHRTSANAGLE